MKISPKRAFAMLRAAKHEADVRNASDPDCPGSGDDPLCQTLACLVEMDELLADTDLMTNTRIVTGPNMRQALIKSREQLVDCVRIRLRKR